jgi:asparagine synthetase B (glutamine-hydrolysing)
MVDKIYAMSSFLQFRAVFGKRKFSDKIGYPNMKPPFACKNIQSSKELYDYIKEYVASKTKNGKAAIALSGGIDSAILAKFMPKGSTAYTFKCVVPGKQVADESIRASEICKKNGLKHKIVEIYWEDYMPNCTPFVHQLMRNKNAPIHSIEVQIYKAAMQAKRDGFDMLIFGENADVKFGGMDSLLSKNFTVGEFIDRYSYVMPYRVLKEYRILSEPYLKYVDNGFVDAHKFMQEIFAWESLNSYLNACETAGIEFASPFCFLEHNPLDIQRVRSGDSKYLVREVYNKLYPNITAAPKTPMPRPMNEWFENWQGPIRPEFWQNCHINMSGDQKYYIYILEQFLNMIDEKK